MKKLLTCLALSLVAASSYAATPLWLRDVQISPDGTEIAFCYKGDIYKVPANGGTATQLTTQASYECSPIWSPDSKQIAFASRPQWQFRPVRHVGRWRSSPASYHPLRLPKYRQPSPPTATISCSRPLSKTLPTVPCSLPRP